MTPEDTLSTSSHRPNDEQPQSKPHEAPDVPEGGIPGQPDDVIEVTSAKGSSQKAQEEQDRQLESGEENPG
jgi:hypothetical protein